MASVSDESLPVQTAVACLPHIPVLHAPPEPGALTLGILEVLERESSKDGYMPFPGSKLSQSEFGLGSLIPIFRAIINRSATNTFTTMLLGTKQEQLTIFVSRNEGIGN